MPRVSVPTEHEEQCALMAWARMKSVAYPDLQWLAAVPNGGHRHKATAAKLKAEGLRAGYPDLVLDVARGGYFGLRIEMKRRKRSCTPESQILWHRRLVAQGYKVVVCAGWEAGSAELTAYLTLPDTLVTPHRAEAP